MPIDFPEEPAVGDAYTFNNRTWLWSGEVWTPDRAKFTADRDIITDQDGYIVAAATSSEEVGHLSGVTSSIQTQLDEKAPTISPTFTGEPLAPTPNVNQNDTAIATTAFVVGQAASVAPLPDASTAAVGTSLRYARQDHVHPADTTLAPINNPTFTGIVTVGSAGIDFADGVQTKQGTPSLTEVKPNISANASTSTLAQALTYRDSISAIAGTFSITIDPDTTNSITFPVGTTINFYQSQGAGGASIVAGSPSVNLLATPGLIFRDQFSSVSITKVAANTWLVFGDLKA